MSLIPFPQRTFAWLALGAITSAGLMLSGCLQDASNDEVKIEPKFETVHRAYFVASDYASALLLALNLDTLSRAVDSLEVFKDSRVVAHGGFVYVLEAFGADNLLKYDPTSGKVVFQKHLRDHLNPVDMDFINDSTALIAGENSPWLYKCNTKTGDLVDSMDLSEFIFIPDSGEGEAASSPHAFAVKVIGDSAVVGLQRRNGDWKFSGGMSQIAVVNLKSKTIPSVLTSKSPNAAELWVDSQYVYMSSQGEYGVPDDGGIYRWRRGSGEMSTLVEGKSLNGDVGSIACKSTGDCLLAISPEWGKTGVFPLDLGSGELSPALPGLTDASGGILYDSGSNRWVIGERAPEASGIVIFDAGLKPLDQKFPMTLPPYSATQVDFRINQ